MKKYPGIIFLFFCLLANGALAQSDSLKKARNSAFDFGLGIGIDYGGIGTRFTLLPSKHVMAFVALGYNFDGPGLNGGIGYLVNPDKRTCVYFAGMYGYNGVIVVQNASQYNGTYYGPSFAIGCQLRDKALRNYFNLELIIPVRSQEFSDDINSLKFNKNVKFDSEPLPFAFSIGFHFG